MAERASIIRRVRNELGDFGKSFRNAYVGDGQTDRYEPPVGMLSADNLRVTTIDPEGPVVRDLLAGVDYVADLRNGVLDLPSALPDGHSLIIEGTAYGLFTDEDLGHYVDDAALLHMHGANTQYRYRDTSGFIRYATEGQTLKTLPEVEEVLVAQLASIEALWTLSTDAATDIDINTSEGTYVPRSQRYRQILQQIEVLTEKYHSLSQQLNVGLYRIEMSDLRRVSRTTGRLVPLYVAREYDDTSYDRNNFHRPTRKLPPIDRQHAEDGPGMPQHTEVPSVDLNFYAGDSYYADVDLPIDLTGKAIRAAARGMNGRIEYFNVDITDAENGQIRMGLTSRQTADFGRTGNYDVQVMDGTGDVTTYLRGRIRVDPQVTP